MAAGNPGARWLAAGLLLGALAWTSRPAHPQQGLREVGESPVESFADDILARADGRDGRLDVEATLVAGSEVEDPEGRIAVSLQAVMPIDPTWTAGRELRVTLFAYDIEAEPLRLQETVRLSDPAASAWWVYRRVVLLPEDFLEAVLVVEDPTADRRGGARVAYGAPLSPAVDPAPRRGLLIDELGLTVAAESRPTPSVLRLVPPLGREHVGEVRIRTIATSDAVERVTFLLDGDVVGEDSSEPFTLTVDLGPERAAREVTAVAYSAAARELGRDRLLLNATLESFDVRLQLSGQADGVLDLEAAVTVPREAALDRVEFYRSETLVATLESAPFVARVPRSDVGSEDYLRAVAYLADGSSLDDVRLPGDVNAGARIEVNLVEVFAVVTNRAGEPITDLEAEDFELRIGRRRVPIERFERATDVALTLGLVFDTSGSMVALMPDAKQAGARFLASIVRDEDRAFLVDFDTRPRLAHGMTRDIGSLLRHFGRLEAKGRTALYDAVVFGALQFDAEPGRRALVVLTDGMPSGSRFGPRDCIKLARERAVPIYSIDLSGVLDTFSTAKVPLLALAKATGGRVHTIPGDPTGLGDYEGVSRALEAAYAQIERELRSQYIMTFTTAEPLTADELKSIEVKVDRPKTQVRRVVGASRT